MSVILECHNTVSGNNYSKYMNVQTNISQVSRLNSRNYNLSRRRDRIRTVDEQITGVQEARREMIYCFLK